MMCCSGACIAAGSADSGRSGNHPTAGFRLTAIATAATNGSAARISHLPGRPGIVEVPRRRIADRPTKLLFSSCSNPDLQDPRTTCLVARQKELPAVCRGHQLYVRDTMLKCNIFLPAGNPG